MIRCDRRIVVGYSSDQTDGGKLVEHSDGDRRRYGPRERVVAIELDATTVEAEAEPSRGFGRTTG